MKNEEIEHVDDVNFKSRTSEHAGAEDTEYEAGYCWYNDQKYSPGSYVCAGRQRMRCEPNGTWSARGGC